MTREELRLLAENPAAGVRTVRHTEFTKSVLNGEDVEPWTYIDLPTCSSREEAEEKWYQPDQDGNFVCDWTDNNNTWNLTVEDVAG